MNIPLSEQLKAVNREIAMRQRVYPRWVSQQKMTQAKADSEIAAMQAVAETIAGLAKGEELAL